MRFLQYDDNGDFYLTQRFLGDRPPYAVLSHTWGEEEDEVKSADLQNGTYKSKPGFKKLQFCGDQARRDGLQYFWCDTCCIDKSDSSELQEAINSMFYWYKNAAKCYVYLADASQPALSEDEYVYVPDTSRVTTNEVTAGQRSWKDKFLKSRWFTRGWALQELLAPASVEFFSKEGTKLGDKASLEPEIREITGISQAALRGRSLRSFSVAERMSWQERRETTRIEDKAYSLLGIFNVHMPLIYGEGEANAFRRLRKEIDVSNAIVRHQIELSSELTAGRISCTFEANELFVTASDQAFVRFDNGVRFHYQGDGHFVIYSGGGTVAWASGRCGPDGSGKLLAFQGDGNLVAYNLPHNAIWATNTYQDPGARLTLSSAPPYIEIHRRDGHRIYHSE